MDRMLVVVFDDQAKVHDGKNTLLQSDSDGSISIYGYAVVTKLADGTITVEQENEPRLLGTLDGSLLGSFIGQLSDPIGAAAGAVPSSTMGIRKAFIRDVTNVLLPNRVAVVAEVAEEWTSPVDARMERLGGVVFRWTLSDVKDMLDAEETSPSQKPSSPDERMAAKLVRTCSLRLVYGRGSAVIKGATPSSAIEISARPQLDS